MPTGYFTPSLPATDEPFPKFFKNNFFEVCNTREPLSQIKVLISYRLYSKTRSMPQQSSPSARPRSALPVLSCLCAGRLSHPPLS